MTEIFAKMAISGVVGLAAWLISFLLTAPVFEAIDAFSEKLGNALLFIHVSLLPISFVVGFIGIIGFIWTS